MAHHVIRGVMGRPLAGKSGKARMGKEARKENWKQIVEGPSCLAKECGLCTVGIEQLLKDFEPRRDTLKRYLGRLV